MILDMIQACQNKFGLHRLWGGNCGMFAFALSTYFPGSTLAVLFRDYDHDANTVDDIVQMETDIYHVVLEYQGKLYDGGGETNVEKLLAMAWDQYRDNDPGYVHQINPDERSMHTLIEGETNWSIGAGDFKMFLDGKFGYRKDLDEMLAEGDVVDLGQHKFNKAVTGYANAMGGVIQGERAFYAKGAKFIPFAESYIASGFDPKFKPEIIMDVSIRHYRLTPELKQFVAELRAHGFKMTQTKYHKSSTMRVEDRDGPWGRKELTLDELRDVWANRDHSPFGAQQQSRLGFGQSHQQTYDARGVGFNVSVGGIDGRRGDKYGNPNHEVHHVIDDDKDFQEVMEMFALIRRAQIKSV